MWSRRPSGKASVICLLLAAAASAAPPQRTPTHAFDEAPAGAPPPGFTFAAMRQPQPGRWLLRREAANGTLVHEADGTASGFSLAIAPDAPRADVLASVRIRFPAAPKTAGLVWRYMDAANYHAAVLDLNRGNVALFRVTDGNRVFLELEDGLELDPAAWHTLKIVHDGSLISVSLGGIRVFNERDRRSERGLDGRAGVIAAGDAEVWFDDLRIERNEPRSDRP